MKQNFFFLELNVIKFLKKKLIFIIIFSTLGLVIAVAYGLNLNSYIKLTLHLNKPVDWNKKFNDEYYSTIKLEKTPVDYYFYEFVYLINSKFYIREYLYKNKINEKNIIIFNRSHKPESLNHIEILISKKLEDDSAIKMVEYFNVLAKSNSIKYSNKEIDIKINKYKNDIIVAKNLGLVEQSSTINSINDGNYFLLGQKILKKLLENEFLNKEDIAKQINEYNPINFIETTNIFFKSKNFLLLCFYGFFSGFIISVLICFFLFEFRKKKIK